MAGPFSRQQRNLWRAKLEKLWSCASSWLMVFSMNQPGWHQINPPPAICMLSCARDDSDVSGLVGKKCKRPPHFSQEVSMYKAEYLLSCQFRCMENVSVHIKVDGLQRSMSMTSHYLWKLTVLKTAVRKIGTTSPRYNNRYRNISELNKALVVITDYR